MTLTNRENTAKQAFVRAEIRSASRVISSLLDSTENDLFPTASVTDPPVPVDVDTHRRALRWLSQWMPYHAVRTPDLPLRPPLKTMYAKRLFESDTSTFACVLHYAAFLRIHDLQSHLLAYLAGCLNEVVADPEATARILGLSTPVEWPENARRAAGRPGGTMWTEIQRDNERLRTGVPPVV